MVGKKRRSFASLNNVSGPPEVEATDSNTSNLTAAIDSEPAKKQFCFKDPNFELSRGVGSAKKTRTWRNLKQIVMSERSQSSDCCDFLYSSLDAPPSFRPAKKYSDLSGLPAPYTDPHTRLRYATAEEYSRICLLPSDIVSGLLTLRHASNNPAQ